MNGAPLEPSQAWLRDEQAQCLTLGSTNYKEGCLCFPQLSPWSSLEVLPLLLPMLGLLTACFLQVSQQQPGHTSVASPPTNTHTVLAALTLLSCHCKETISYLLSPIVLHVPSREALSLQRWCECLVSSQTSLSDHLKYRSQPRHHEVNLGSVSPTATAPHGYPTPHGPCCHRVVVSSLSLSLSRLFQRCFQLHGILHSGCTIELKILFSTVQQRLFLNTLSHI